MTDVPIVIVSHGRAGNVKTLNLFDGNEAAVCVAESQYPLYHDADPGAEYVIHPDSVVGIAQKRQWVFDRFGDVFMLDDDMEKCVDMTRGPGEPNDVRGDRLSAVIQRAHQTAEDAGIMVYGFPVMVNPLYYNPLKPFSINGRLYAGHMGMRKEGVDLYFPSHLRTGDDDWLACLNAYHYRIHLIDNRYAFQSAPMYQTAGGLSGFRSTELIENTIAWMKEQFGSDVVKTKDGRPDIKLPW